MATTTEPRILRDLRAMDPIQFEYLVADIWSELGYLVDVKEASGDKGVDVEANDPETGEKVVIQAKRYAESNRIGRPKIQQYHSLYQQEGADEVVVISTGYFADTAKESAQELDVTILNGQELCAELADLENGDEITEYHLGRKSPNQRRWGNNYTGRSTVVQAVVALLGGAYLLGGYGVIASSVPALPIPSQIVPLLSFFAMGTAPGIGLALLAMLAISVVLLIWAYLWRWKAAGLLLPVSLVAALIVSTMKNPDPWMLWTALLASILSPIVVPAMFSFTAHWRALSWLRRHLVWWRRQLGFSE
ncbi:restriction endonuclease [Halobium palmae]|uniref:Restriction endonuclease n=1 Tax=Halobium palmae TaxID=1776492 RepID=A0ABD5RUV9_9EURY